MGGEQHGAPRLVRVAATSGIPAALDTAGVPRPRPVLVLVGGAARMDEAAGHVLDGVLREVMVPCVERARAVVVDGGTDSGVMRMLGLARAGRGFALVGVAAAGTVLLPGGDAVIDDAAEPEPHHSHLVLVPGTAWGDESPWLADVADAIAGAGPSVTVVVNGGEITYADVAQSVGRGRPVVVLAGTGRTADAIARARSGRDGDPRAAAAAASPLVRVVAVDDAAALRAELDGLLGGPGSGDPVPGGTA